ncbi:MAG: hypothetical protein K8S23_15430 [Candidatus Cloacimonetes bacterium]|nr:hypothetical protein [Candidatus Cloacimonadota bacterium]
MKLKFSVLQIVIYVILSITLVISILTFLKLKSDSKWEVVAFPVENMMISIIFKELNLTSQQQRLVDKIYLEMDMIYRQDIQFIKENKKMESMMNLLVKKTVLLDDLVKYEQERSERSIQHSGFYNKKWLEATSLLTPEQVDKSFQVMAKFWAPERKKQLQQKFEDFISEQPKIIKRPRYEGK